MRLGEMYRDGKGTEVDYTTSVHWLMESAMQGNIIATADIITMYVSKQIDDTKAYDIAMSIMAMQANSGNIDAINRMGNFYYDGVGVKKDYAVAMSWYEKAANLGNSWSKMRLGEMYRDGKGTEVDYEKMLKWYSG